jgi:hypothetical protein
MTKKYFFFLIAALLVITGKVTAAEEWQEKRSTHFIVYYKGAPDDFISTLSYRAEDYYNSIADNLGFSRFDFWLWDNRAKIYVYDDAATYQRIAGGPEWSAGYAAIEEKTIYTYVRAKDFDQTILPHELAHIIFREFVGMRNPAVTLWLDEGVASFQQKERTASSKVVLKEALKKGRLIPLEKLSRIDPRHSSEEGLVALYYYESASVIEFLISEFGKDRFVIFCQNLRDKRDLESTISATYHFNNLKEMDAAWQKYLTR